MCPSYISSLTVKNPTVDPPFRPPVGAQELFTREPKYRCSLSGLSEKCKVAALFDALPRVAAPPAHTAMASLVQHDVSVLLSARTRARQLCRLPERAGQRPHTRRVNVFVNGVARTAADSSHAPRLPRRTSPVASAPAPSARPDLVRCRQLRRLPCAAGCSSPDDHSHDNNVTASTIPLSTKINGWGVGTVPHARARRSAIRWEAGGGRLREGGWRAGGQAQQRSRQTALRASGGSPESRGEHRADADADECVFDAAVDLVLGEEDVAGVWQGRTLIHFSAQCKRFVRDRGCI